MAEKIAPSTETVTRILIVDDHPIVRQGLARLLEVEAGLAVCGEAESAADAIEAVTRLKPDLVLLDLSLGDKPGLELIKQLRADSPGSRVVVISMHDEAVWAERVLRVGACGYVMKQEKPRVLINRIRQAIAGGLSLSEQMSERLVRKFTGQSPTTQSAAVDELGDRELEVLHLIGEGKKTKDIAAAMHISTKTVEAHRENLKRKLGFSGIYELLRYAVMLSMGTSSAASAETLPRGKSD